MKLIGREVLQMWYSVAGASEAMLISKIVRDSGLRSFFLAPAILNLRSRLSNPKIPQLRQQSYHELQRAMMVAGMLS